MTELANKLKEQFNIHPDQTQLLNNAGFVFDHVYCGGVDMPYYVTWKDRNFPRVKIAFPVEEAPTLSKVVNRIIGMASAIGREKCVVG